MSLEMELDTKTDSKKILVMQSNMLKLIDDVNKAWAEINALKKLLLTGNGEISLVEQVRDNTQFINGIRKVIWIVGGAVLLQTISFGYAVLVAYFRFLPVLEKLAETSSP